MYFKLGWMINNFNFFVQIAEELLSKGLLAEFDKVTSKFEFLIQWVEHGELAHNQIGEGL
jgi:hypothetical protein